ncbi:MAG: protein-glutamine glutaminase family protein [Jatrophihabitans sp.]
MPDQDYIVAQRIRLGGEAEQLSVTVDDGRVLRFDAADAKTRPLTDVLRSLEALGHPAYLILADDVITGVRVPAVGRVEQLVDATDPAGPRYVQLDTTQARHVLLPEADDRFGVVIRQAASDHSPVLLTSDDRGVILDVRAWEPGPDDGPRPPLPPFPPIGPVIPQWLRWIPFIKRIWPWLYWLYWPWWPWWWFHGISPAHAQQVFDAMSATSCAPLTVPAPCIPFLYPDDGCWARAHEMCRLMINMGLSPRKIWIDHSAGYWLTVATKNSPNCQVTWGWHVAPTLLVRTPWFFFGQPRVIDPSLFTTPVSEATWKGVQGDPGATLTPTRADQFWHGGGTDPTYAQSNAILAQYRAALRARSLQDGPPPYAYC